MFKSMPCRLIPFAISICFVFGSTPAALALSANQTQTIIIAQYGHIFLYMPIYVALDKGFFKEQGLDVKLISTGGDEKTFTAIASGNAQFGVSDPTFVAIARQRGQGGKVIAGIVRRVPFAMITFEPSIRKISQPSDFAGHRIAALPAPSTCYAVIENILQNNGHPVRAKIVPGALGTFPAMLKAGQADMAMEFEPNISSLTTQSGRIIYSTVGYFGDTAFTGMTVSDSFYSQHPQEIQAAVNAVAKAMRYIHHDFAGTALIAKQEFPEIPETVIKTALQRLIDEGTTPVSPVLTRAAWNKAIALRKEIGDLQGTGSYEENVDMKFAQMAVH